MSLKSYKNRTQLEAEIRPQPSYTTSDGLFWGSKAEAQLHIHRRHVIHLIDELANGVDSRLTRSVGFDMFVDMILVYANPLAEALAGYALAKLSVDLGISLHDGDGERDLSEEGDLPTQEELEASASEFEKLLAEFEHKAETTAPPLPEGSVTMRPSEEDERLQRAAVALREELLKGKDSSEGGSEGGSDDS